MSMDVDHEDRWSTAWLMAATALVLGVGVSILDRTLASAMAIVAFGFAATGLVLSRSAVLSGVSQRSVVLLLGLGIGVEVLIAMAAPPMQDLRFLAGLVAVAILSAAASAVPRWRTLTMLAATAVYLACLAYLVIAMIPNDIDVYLFQQEGAAALLSGRNPYELRYPNIYGTETPFYSPDVMDGAFLTFGFPYPPISLLMAVPGYLLGDYRLAAAVAVALTGLLAATARPGPVGPLAAALLWLSPLAFRVVYNGWTEPFVGLLAGAVGFAAVRRARSTPVLLGVLVAVKQYVFPLLGLAMILLPRVAGRWRAGLVAVGVALASIAPFLALDPQAFVYSVGLVQLLQPFRLDSVSIPGLIARAGGPELPAITAFAVLALALTIAAWRSPRTTAGFFLAASVSFLAFFLFSKQAFMNYYWFAMAAAVLSVGATEMSGERARQLAESGRDEPHTHSVAVQAALHRMMILDCGEAYRR